MTRYLKLMAAMHSDEPWTAVRHVDVADPQLVDYAVEAGVMTGDAPYATGDGGGFGSSNGDGAGGGYGYGDGNGHGDGDSGGFGDGYGYGDGNGYGDGDGGGLGDGHGSGTAAWGGWSSCRYYHEEVP